MLCEIPEEISCSWYSSEVPITMKDSVLEPSSPIRHSKEIATIIKLRVPEKPVLFIYSDEGPDDRVTYLSAKLLLIALFLKTSRLSRCYSYCSIPFIQKCSGAVMSIVNLALQAIALATRDGSRSSKM